ncbi:predicted protein, partial [Nematostella vectensis]
LSLEKEHISALDDEELPAPKRSSVVLTSRPGSRKDSAPPKPPRSRGTSVSIDEKLEAENPLSENKLREEKPATPEAPPRRLTVNKEDEEKTKSTEAVSPKPKRPAPPRPTVPSQGRSEGDKIQAEGDKDAVKPSRPAPPAPRRPPPPAVKQDGEKEVLPVLLKGDSTDSESDDEGLPVSAPKPTGPPKKKTYHITHEILSTERTFVEALRLAYEASKKCKGLMLNSFMLKPVQRIPSYRLLLIDYLKHLPPESAEYQDIKGIYQTGKSLEALPQRHARAHIFPAPVGGNQYKLRETLPLLGMKEFIKQGNLLKLCRKDMQERTFFLLTDVLLYTAPVGGNQYKLRETLPLLGMKDVVAQETIPVLGYEVEEMRKSGDDIEFQLRHAGLQPIHFKAENEASALRWTEGLKKASTI